MINETQKKVRTDERSAILGSAIMPKNLHGTSDSIARQDISVAAQEMNPANKGNASNACKNKNGNTRWRKFHFLELRPRSVTGESCTGGTIQSH